MALASVSVVTMHMVSYFPISIARVGCARLFGAVVGAGTVIHHGLNVRGLRKLKLGADCYVSENVVLDARGGLSIGDHVSIGVGAQIWTAQHDVDSSDFAFESAPVSVGDRAWISARAIVLPGCSIGEGAVVAAGAVVVSDLPEWTVCAGVPARPVRARPVVDTYRLESRRNKIWWY